ncbi:unnamed protein product, partial [Ectocarpus sp. 12 AP-2014]
RRRLTAGLVAAAGFGCLEPSACGVVGRGGLEPEAGGFQPLRETGKLAAVGVCSGGANIFRKGTFRQRLFDARDLGRMRQSRQNLLHRAKVRASSSPQDE